MQRRVDLVADHTTLGRHAIDGARSLLSNPHRARVVERDARWLIERGRQQRDMPARVDVTRTAALFLDEPHVVAGPVDDAQDTDAGDSAYCATTPVGVTRAMPLLSATQRLPSGPSTMPTGAEPPPRSAAFVTAPVALTRSTTLLPFSVTHNELSGPTQMPSGVLPGSSGTRSNAPSLAMRSTSFASRSVNHIDPSVREHDAEPRRTRSRQLDLADLTARCDPGDGVATLLGGPQRALRVECHAGREMRSSWAVSRTSRADRCGAAVGAGLDVPAWTKIRRRRAQRLQPSRWTGRRGVTLFADSSAPEPADRSSVLGHLGSAAASRAGARLLGRAGPSGPG